jgi:hypothetical protein
MKSDDLEIFLHHLAAIYLKDCDPAWIHLDSSWWAAASSLFA